MSKITLYQKPFELDRVKHYLIFLFRFLLLGDIMPPAYPLYDLEIGEHALYITTNEVPLLGGTYLGNSKAIPFDDISFCSLNKKKKEIHIEVSGQSPLWFWYRKSQDQVELFYNQLADKL